MEDLVLIDLVDGYILQQLQDLFISKSNIATGISGANGEAYTAACTLSDFCERYTKQTEKGRARCHECDCENARRALKSGCAMAYTCHAGLTDFTAPISINGELYGFIVGGQISTKPLQKEKVYALAEELGINPEEYWEAAKKIQIVDEEQLSEALRIVDDISHIISDIAINKYKVLKANEEIEAAARMKSDFLANMSHEIRTPMNAVIGMANMALREDLPADARTYINQIKRSGNTLLAIINDILDFSKIESGKMDITLAEYSPIKMIEDVANIVITRIGEKNVELLLDVSEALPGELMGDATRIKQVIMNLANNAVKFTREGYVKVCVKCRKTSEKSYDLSVSVEDSGIGIKKEDLEKIFDSFQQVDSKRNRNIEGTGLGLAISRQLVNLMGGKLEVESEYEVGSKFSFTIPQLALRDVAPPRVHNKADIRCVVCISNPCSSAQLISDIQVLGGECVTMTMEKLISCLEDGTYPTDFPYLFIENREITKQLETVLSKYPDIIKVVLLRFKAVCNLEQENTVKLHKPVYTYPLIRLFNKEDLNVYSDDEEEVIDFEAPDANILIVDDNEVNLAVAEGLLKPLKMHVDTALSGAKAVDMISEKRYDIIFMDHMMPGMDGVETTHIIRRFHPEYDSVPIIALTANALEEAKMMFLCEGMNDFLAKPIEVNALISMVKNYLPPEKINRVCADAEKDASMEYPDIPGLDMKHAEALLGSRELLWQIIGNYYRSIPKKRQKIKEYYDAADWEGYTIEVHALKSASRQIGALELGELAEALEHAGNENRTDIILRDTGKLFDAYDRLRDVLASYFPETEAGIDDTDKKPYDKAAFFELLDRFFEAIDDLDSTSMETIVRNMASYRLEDDSRMLLDSIMDAVADIDIDTCEELAQKLRQILDK